MQPKQTKGSSTQHAAKRNKQSAPGKNDSADWLPAHSQKQQKQRILSFNNNDALIIKCSLGFPVPITIRQ